MIDPTPPSELERELAAVHPLADPIAGSARLPYDRLGPDDFERLLWALFDAEREQADFFDRATLMNNGADRGRDVWLTLREKPAGLVQCKLSAGVSAPTAIREVITFLLFAQLDPRIAPTPGFRYHLAVAKNPAETTINLFDAPACWIADNSAEIEQQLKKSIADHASFRGFDAIALLGPVTAQLAQLEYRLIRPHQLDAMAHEAPRVASRFFQERVVVDAEAAREIVREMLADPAHRSPTAPATLMPAPAEPALRLLCREDTGFEAASDEDLGLSAAEFVAERARNPAATIAVEMVDDFGIGEEIRALQAKTLLNTGERDRLLILRGIEDRYRQTARDLACELEFLLVTTIKLGPPWFGGRNYATQGRALRRLADLHKIPAKPINHMLKLVAYPSPRQFQPTVHIHMDETETKAFMTRHGFATSNEINNYAGYCVLDLAQETQVTSYAPALAKRLCGLARNQGVAIETLLKDYEEPFWAWTISIA